MMIITLKNASYIWTIFSFSTIFEWDPRLSIDGFCLSLAAVGSVADDGSISAGLTIGRASP